MIVLTGGAGFIGSCILARLNALGRRDVLVVDHLESGDLKEKNLAGKGFADYINKTEFLKQVLAGKWDKGVTVTIHMGACSSTTLQDAQYFEENNFQYSCHLAEWASRNSVRFIYASSAATYGDGSLGYSDEDEVTRRLKPLNLYGDSKQRFDLWVLEKGLADQMVGLKFFNVFGPNEYHKGEMRSVVAKTFKRVAGEGKIALFKSYKEDYKDGEQKRDFIYIKDAVDIVMHFYDHAKISGLYNVGSGMARTWNDLALALFAAVGRKPNIEYVEMPADLRPRYQYFTEANITKLRKSGFKKKFTSLEESVKDYARYLEMNSYL